MVNWVDSSFSTSNVENPEELIIDSRKKNKSSSQIKIVVSDEHQDAQLDHKSTRLGWEGLLFSLNQSSRVEVSCF